MQRLQLFKKFRTEKFHIYVRNNNNEVFVCIEELIQFLSNYWLISSALSLHCLKLTEKGIESKRENEKTLLVLWQGRAKERQRERECVDSGCSCVRESGNMGVHGCVCFAAIKRKRARFQRSLFGCSYQNVVVQANKEFNKNHKNIKSETVSYYFFLNIYTRFV